VSQKAPSRQVGRQFLSSASPHCYFERLTCLTGGFRTSCIWPEARCNGRRGYRILVILLRGWLAKTCGLLRLDTTPSSRNFIAISMVLSSPRAVDLSQ
jgi:hypothetical protein